MGDIKFKGEIDTWANNGEGEGFIQERLNRFFGSVEWMIQYDTAKVKHFLRQASDHSLIILDTKTQGNKTKTKIIFETSWTKRQENEDMVKDGTNQ